MNLFEGQYDGELCFEIENTVIDDETITMDLVAEYQSKTVGLQVVVPILSKRVLFKNFLLPNTAKPMKFCSNGECSDRFVTVLDKLWKPDFIVEGKFDPNPVEIEYAILNKDMVDLMNEKIYTRVYAQIDMETGDPFDNFNLEIGFNFNLNRKRASFVERKREMRNDFLAMLVE